MWTRRTFIKGVAGLSLTLPFAGRGFAQEPIRIGHQADLTGVGSAFGFWNDRAARAAVDKINAEGGIAGRPIELFTEDTRSGSNDGVQAFRSLA
jgi:branched-chain amino acid transport system substrate-binding protein